MFAYAHTPIYTCACTHTYIRSVEKKNLQPLLPHQKYRLFLFLQGTITVCGRKRRGVCTAAWHGGCPCWRSLLSAGVWTRRARCDLMAPGLQPAPLRRWGWTYGRGKWYSVYSAPAILNVLFNNLSREEVLLLIFNTKMCMPSRYGKLFKSSARGTHKLGFPSRCSLPVYLVSQKLWHHNLF